MPKSPRSPTLEQGAAALVAKLEKVPLPQGAWERLTAHLDDAAPSSPAHTRRWAWVWVVPAMATLAGAGFWLWPAPKPAGFVVQTHSDDAQWQAISATELAVTHGSAALVVPGLTVQVLASKPAQLRREATGVRVLSGQLQVQGDATQTPVPLWVSHGMVEVLGARFVVTQEQHGGSIEVQAGTATFIDDQGGRVVLAAGDRLAWPRVDLDLASPQALPAPAVVTPAPMPGNAAPSRTGVHRLAPTPPGPGPQTWAQLEPQVEAYRVRNDYAGLESFLRALLRDVKSEPLREQVSYELCDVLAVHGGSHEALCLALDAHLSRYPTGSTGAAARTLVRLNHCQKAP